MSVLAQSEIEVRCWDDPIVDRLGIGARSEYTETYWLPIIGPSAFVVLRRLTAMLDCSPLQLVVNVTELGEWMGLSGKLDGQLVRAIDRLARFGFATRVGDLLLVRRNVPLLSARLVARLPLPLREAHGVHAAALREAA